MDYLLHIFILICFYTLLSQSLNLSAGFSGLISLAHAGFFGIGAYTSAILSLNFGFSFWGSLPIGLIISGLIALLISLIALRTIEEYFIICTLGIQILIFSLMNNWLDLTKGPLGLPGIPTISLFGFSFENNNSFFVLILAFMLFIWFLLRNIANSGFGKTLIAINNDEVYSQSIGKNVYKSKIVSFSMSAMIASIPGALYAHYVSYIDPTSFTINESIFILTIVIIGGFRSLTGSFLASAFLILLPELLRFVGIPDSIAANMRQVIYGLILVIIMMSGKNGIKELFSFELKK